MLIGGTQKSLASARNAVISTQMHSTLPTLPKHLPLLELRQVYMGNTRRVGIRNRVRLIDDIGRLSLSVLRRFVVRWLVLAVGGGERVDDLHETYKVYGVAASRGGGFVLELFMYVCMYVCMQWVCEDYGPWKEALYLTCLCMYVCMYVCIGVARSMASRPPVEEALYLNCVCMYVCMYVSLLQWTLKNIHTYIHTYILGRKPPVNEAKFHQRGHIRTCIHVCIREIHTRPKALCK
jgi:hypothetical protein